MARAKSTRRAEARAEARRRYRAAQAAARADAANDPAADPTEDAKAQTSRQGLPFRIPDVRADVVALPGLIRERPLILAPVALMLSAFALTFVPPPTDSTAQFLYTFYISSFLYPQAILAMFLGGVLAPRASYLVGLLIGIINGVLIVALAATRSSTTIGGMPFTALVSGTIPYLVLLALYGLAIGAFAGWYRDFLRRSSERRRAMADQRAREKRRESRRGARAAR